MPSSLESTLESTKFEVEIDLPVTDFSELPLDFEGEEGLENLQYHPGVVTIREACKEFGFFRVVNAGIPVDLLQNVDSAIHQLFSMPQEIKDRAHKSNPVDTNHLKPSSESFCVPKLPDSDSVQALSDKIWPEEGNPKFCETIRSFTFFLEDLKRKISKIIIASLGLDVKTFYHSDLEKCPSYMWIHHYSSNGRISMEEEALISHTDLGCFTIIYQDSQWGLQIRSKEGKWLNVRPLSHSFVINIADCLKAWTNGRYRSAEHRVVHSGWTERISLAFFVPFPDDKQIWAPAELVDDDHPRRYRPFIFSDYKRDFINNLASKQENLMRFVEHYASLSTET